MASGSDQFNDLHIIQEHFKTIFIDNGVIPHLSQALFTHAHFAEIYYKSYNFLMKSNGPLPLDWRSYIAILAASRHSCKYLVRRLEVEFLLNGGNEEWLKGIEFIPQKLKKLLKFNSLLCHMPWMLNEDSISELVSNNGVGENAWTMAELVHAVIIMTHFHALSGFIYGIGILPDDDDTPIADIISSVTESEESKQRQKNETQRLVETLTRTADDDDTPIDKHQREKAFECTETNDNSSKIVPNHLYSNYNNFDCFSTPNFASVTFWEAQKQDMMKGATKKSDSEGLIPSAGHTFISSNTSGVYKRNSNNRERSLKLKKYKHNKYDFTYKDFDVKNKEYETTSIHDFNWEENAFSLLSRFYYGAADLLDTEFEFIYNMTDNRCYDIKDVDTTSFRAAIWCYVHRLFGVSHDDFNYEKVNKLLNIDLKKYIKTVVCYPERCTKEQFVNTGVKLRTREKIHICLLAIEARKQVEIIYGLRSINNFMQ
ncbi:sestrin [Naegleria gruberi]|uniref:Sestrin n=1 Tax=Naegleria gruberi TaxID=5762 RepID=D2VK84_NAEGR|nr:sestrin [Naegleria gruberi]EFC42903.1 sestrin [Naegleria gruberi]|eukprot:XP_002675647.1 sestrin [Naegleria gruberi]